MVPIAYILHPGGNLPRNVQEFGGEGCDLMGENSNFGHDDETQTGLRNSMNMGQHDTDIEY